MLRRDEEDVTRRECLFYTAMGYARLKDYERALQFIDIVCMDEPNNMQVLSLKKCIEKRQRKGAHVTVRARMCVCEQTRSSVAPFWAARRWWPADWVHCSLRRWPDEAADAIDQPIHA